MDKTVVQRRIIKSISEWSVFKIAIVAYLIVFILSVIIFGIIAVITWAGFKASGINLNNLFANTNFGSMLSGFGIKLPNLNIVFGTGGIVGIVLFIVFGLLFSVVYAAIAVFWTWIFNVIIKISGGLEIRYTERITKVENKILENTPTNN
ncbi:MAG: DUF3566 domain-containing protein [Actinomycetota bacterium]|nr:DUF3566 domain-containing protein [Actinomycetota bacterium]